MMRPKKSLAQHFLRCRWVIETMLTAARINRKDIILEVGPGTGILTRALARASRCVIAVEKDEWLAEKLQNELTREKIENVEVIAADILNFLKSEFPHRGELENIKVVANIPYYLTARLLRRLLEWGLRSAEGETRRAKWPKVIVLTVQKEVAERIVARPPRMNLLALSVHAFGTPAIIKKVPAACFTPKPKVDSAIVTISDISDVRFVRSGVSPKNFFDILHLAFSQKRKLLASSLGKKFEKSLIKNALTYSALSHRTRPGELDIEQWFFLVRRICQLAQKW